MVISERDVQEALKNLSSGKAASFDLLNDRTLKKALRSSLELRLKVAHEFTQWLNGNKRIPEYLLRARTVLLSKEDGNAFPEFGKCRVIAILPILTKLFEICLLEKLRAEMAEKCPIHTKQRGFVKGGSTIQNIADL